jgi:hypothetical protein
MAVKSYNKLCNNIQDISFFIHLVLCYSNPPELHNVADPEKNLGSSFDPYFPYENFINEIRQFYEDTNFEHFFEDSQNEYEKIISDYGNGHEVEKYITIVDNYFGNDTKNYTVIISALLMGNFGIEVLTNENVKFNYSVLSPCDYEDNKYIFGPKNSIMEIIFHEASHLRINDLTKTYIDRFNVYEKPIPDDFVKQFYTDIETIINEYIIRAITIRLFEISHEEEFVEYLLQDSIQKGFKEIETIKDYISKNCEVDNKIITNEKYIELMDYVINKI